MKTYQIDHDGRQEVLVLAALSVSTAVLQKVAALFGEGPFSSPVANTIGRLCLEHLAKNKEAPGRVLEKLCWDWTERHGPEMGKALDALFQQVEAEASTLLQDGVNTGYYIDLAGKVLKRAALRRKHEQVGQLLESGEVEAAETELLGYRKPNLGAESGSHLFTDSAAWDALFNEEESDVLVTYTGGLKDFFADALSRECFVAFMASTGVGKTWFLVDLAWRALLNRRKTVFITIGDMTEKQIKRRFLARAAKRPLKNRPVRYPIAVGPGTVRFEEKVFNEPLNKAGALAVCERVMGHFVKSAHSHFYLTARPARSLNVAGIRTLLDELEQGEGFKADVICLDYADMLGPEPYARKEDFRTQTNETWTQLSALRMERHCLVVTATQANRQGLSAKVLRREHTSEDRRKADHVTGMIGVNQTDDEQEKGLYRLNWMKAREMEYQSSRCCHVAGCLAIGNPAVLSCYGDEEVTRSAAFARNGHSEKEKS